MTGYGKAESNTHNKKFTVEIKSLNSKQIDMNVRVPGSYRDKELSIRKLLSTALSRGKIDCSLYVENTGTEKTANINKIILAIFSLQRYALDERDKLVELEINPLLVKSNQVVAADALIRENY